MIGRRLLDRLSRGSFRRPGAWLAAAALISLPALVAIGELGLDTDLIRLLPEHSRAASETRELEAMASGGGSFTLILEGDDRRRLIEALHETARRAEGLESVRSVEYEQPVDFVEDYRFLLIPEYYLRLIQDLVLDWEAEVNPFVVDLGDPGPTGDETDRETGSEDLTGDRSPADTDGDEDAAGPGDGAGGLSFAEREDRKEIARQLDHYGDLPRYHESEDGETVGLTVRPRHGITSLGETRALFSRLQELTDEISDRYGVWAGVSGSLRNKVDEYDLIVSDLERSGFVAGTAILVVLWLAFGTLAAIPVVLLPLLVGLLWAFALVPATVGDLNTITAFLLLVMFGMGIDFSIHLVKRFEAELSRRDSEDALVETYRSTGVSVILSALTTALALGVLALSDFRGFSEFGVIGGLSMLAVLAAMLVVLPATMVLGRRFRLLRPTPLIEARGRLLPGRAITAVLAAAVFASLVLTATVLRFDYEFDNLSPVIPQSDVVKEKQRRVYTTSRTPAAVYVAPDLDTLDRTLEILERQRRRPDSTIGRIASIRDFAPTDGAADDRLTLIESIQEEVRGSWTRRLEDPSRRRWLEDLQAWEPPDRRPSVEEVPPELGGALRARDGSGAWLVGVFTDVERSDGRNAMAFTRELYGLELPDDLRGPIGETPVFAEILWLVIGESPWMIVAALLGVALLIFLQNRSFRDTAWTLLPLVAGILLALGVMAALGLKLNFFNMVVIPALLGMGVDDGVHYVRRWRELDGDTPTTQTELLGPLTVTTATTMMGYSGMVFANHPGLHSIGVVACIGLTCTWITTLFLLPGLLRWIHGPAAGSQ